MKCFRRLILALGSDDTLDYKPHNGTIKKKKKSSVH